MTVIYKKSSLAQCITLISIGAASFSHASQSQIVAELPVITVQAVRDNAATKTAVDPENSYTLSNTKAATKLDLTLKQTPQSVTVITAKQIQVQQITNLSDALDQVVGVHQRRFGTSGAMGIRGESGAFYARNAQITNISIDGVMSSAAVDNQMGLSIAELDPAIYESIALVKGASVLSTGAGNPSASIHLSRKRATAMQAQGQFSVRANSFDHSWGGFRETLDVQSPLNAAKTVRGRSVISYDQQHSFKQWGDRQRGLFYGTVAIDPNPETQVNLGVMFQNVSKDGVDAYSQTMFANGLKSTASPRDSAAPRWTYDHTETTNVFADLKHHFENGWHLNFNYNYLKQSSDGIWGAIADAPQRANFTNNTGVVFAGIKKVASESHGIDLSATKDYALWGHQHDFIFGANYQSFNSNDLYSAATGKTWVSLNKWDGQVAIPVDLNTKNREVILTDTHQYGIFAATRLNLLENLHTILGLRFSSYKILSLENGEVGHDFSGHDVVTPYAGLVFDLNQYISVYSSYSKIYRPQTAQKLDKSPIGPLEGNSYEAGVKVSLNEDRLNLSAAYFESQLENSIEFEGRRPNGYRYYRAVKGVNTSGFELEMVGEISPAWQIQTGYTYVKSIDTGRIIHRDQPKNMFKLHTLYQLPGILNQWQIGGGMRWQSETVDTTKNGAAFVAHRQKPFTVLDLLAQYQLDADTTLGLNIHNIGNTQYRTNVLQSTYADPRGYILSLSYRF